ncbi:hypothetical protein Btru_019102 [Bulinus truncatus]|nr:hypothetical protein Btru_019102 [Bulinus truncatus]
MVFPSGHPSKYSPRPTLVDFGDQTRTGIFNVFNGLSIYKVMECYQTGDKCGHKMKRQLKANCVRCDVVLKRTVDGVGTVNR